MSSTTPMSVTEKLSRDLSAPLSSEDALKYKNVVGGLQYLTLTRSDISFVVNKMCRCLSQPTTVHYEAAKRFGESKSSFIHAQYIYWCLLDGRFFHVTWTLCYIVEFAHATDVSRSRCRVQSWLTELMTRFGFSQSSRRAWRASITSLYFVVWQSWRHVHVCQSDVPRAYQTYWYWFSLRTWEICFGSSWCPLNCVKRSDCWCSH